MKYAIDSKGQIITLPENQNIIRLIPQEIREKELLAFAKEFTTALSEKGIEENGKGFCFMIQPFYTTERILLLTKTEFSSSSQAVKLANEIDKHPEILANREQTEFLRSILPEDYHGRTRWYLLTVGYIAFERNFYDCKRINANYVLPISYAKFIKDLKSQLVTQDDMDSGNICFRYKLTMNDIDLKNTNSLLFHAFNRDIINGQESHFDTLVLEFLETYKKRNYAMRDVTSNQTAGCLSAINDGDKHIFPIYQEVKNCIKKTSKGAYNIQYKGNRITACFADGSRKFALYVSGTKENPQFIIGGKTIAGMDALKKAIQDGSVFQEMEWFTEKVKPNIKQTPTKQKYYIRKKDEIGWRKRHKVAPKIRDRRDRKER